MKRKIFNLGLIFALALSIMACGGKKDESKQVDNKLGKLEVEIPKELKNNKEAVAYIETATGIVDDYALILDNYLDVVSKYDGKSEEDLSFKEKVKLTTATTKLFANVGIVGEKWDACEAEKTLVYSNLSDKEQEAMDVVLDHISGRLIQLEEKYENLDK